MTGVNDFMCTDVFFTVPALHYADEPKAAGHKTVCGKVCVHNFGQNIHLSLTVDLPLFQFTVLEPRRHACTSHIWPPLGE